MRLDELLNRSGEWLSGTGPESDIVISSRIRLARNIEGYSFLSRTTAEENEEIVEYVKTKWRSVGLEGDYGFFDLTKLDALDRLFLVERHLISKEHASAEIARGIILGKSERVSVMINEEDHMRVQVLQSGLQLRQIWDEIDILDDKANEVFEYSYSPQFGYLTCCPTNVGTGMRASVMLHLPALAMTKQIKKVFESVSKIGLAVRGLYGEGTYASGDFYQVSNQITLGKSELTILENLESIIPQIVRYERNVRETLLSQTRKLLEDRVWRAYGILKNVRITSSNETMDMLSAVRLGVNLELIDDVNIAVLNQLFISIQPAHLQKIENRRLNEQERDMVRADFLRSKLNP